MLLAQEAVLGKVSGDGLSDERLAGPVGHGDRALVVLLLDDQFRVLEIGQGEAPGALGDGTQGGDAGVEAGGWGRGGHAAIVIGVWREVQGALRGPGGGDTVKPVCILQLSGDIACPPPDAGYFRGAPRPPSVWHLVPFPPFGDIPCPS